MKTRLLELIGELKESRRKARLVSKNYAMESPVEDVNRLNQDDVLLDKLEAEARNVNARVSTLPEES